MATHTENGKTYDYWLVNARSWWIATELCRRHARLAIREWRDGPRASGDGPRDSLGLFDEVRGVRTIDINRAGDLTVGEDGSAPDLSVEWSRVFTSPALGTVLELEQAAGLPAPQRSLRTAGPLLTYRIVTALVAGGSTSTRPCEVRSALAIGPGHRPAEHLFADFPGAEERRRSLGGGQPGNHPDGEDGGGSGGQPDDAAHRFWAVQRNGEVACLLDDAGRVYRRDVAPVDLHPAFDAAGRKIGRLVADEFAGLVD